MPKLVGIMEGIMNKALNKIVLKCILAVCIIFVPFIFANYFIASIGERGEGYYEYDTFVTIIIITLNILQAIVIAAAGFIIRYRNKSVIIENIYFAKKYLIGSLIGLVIVVLMLFSGIYTDLYYITAETLNVFDKAPLLVICWEQLMNGKFLFELLLCVFVCFIHKIRKEQRF